MYALYSNGCRGCFRHVSCFRCSKKETQTFATKIKQRALQVQPDAGMCFLDAAFVPAAVSMPVAVPMPSSVVCLDGHDCSSCSLNLCAEVQFYVVSHHI